MVESNIVEGKQPLLADRSALRYGVSLTDGCIGWETTERLLTEAYHALEKRC
jgi:3-deoxy-7-phosphoheptulonate synthase